MLLPESAPAMPITSTEQLLTISAEPVGTQALSQALILRDEHFRIADNSANSSAAVARHR